MNATMTIGQMDMPINFKYKDVLLRGKPSHQRYDEFSIKHPDMPNSRRAKIFSPFDALKGFSEAVSAKEELYVFKRELGEEERSVLDRKLQVLRRLTYNGRMARANKVTVTVSYYVPCFDENHFAFGHRGQYKTITGICWGVDPDITHSIKVGNTVIGLDDIEDITAADPRIFERVDWD